MKEVLDIIYTHEEGQIQLTLPLSRVLEDGAFESKEKFENKLIWYWQIINSDRPITEAILFQYKLVKISTCIYSDKMDTPVWYGDWDGKFYYPKRHWLDKKE